MEPKKSKKDIVIPVITKVGGVVVDPAVKVKPVITKIGDVVVDPAVKTKPVITKIGDVIVDPSTMKPVVKKMGDGVIFKKEASSKEEQSNITISSESKDRKNGHNHGNNEEPKGFSRLWKKNKKK